MRSSKLCAAAFLLTACVTGAPKGLVLPPAQTVDGVRIQVTHIRRSHTRFFGLAGEAVNSGVTPVTRLTASYQVLDSQGASIGVALVQSTNLAPGEVREFEAEFSGPGVTSVGSILPGRIKVFR